MWSFWGYKWVEPTAAELNGAEPLLFEEVALPVLDDAILHADYALAQVMLRLNLPVGNIHTGKAELLEYEGQSYQFKSVTIYNIADIRGFTDALSSALLAWSPNADLLADIIPAGRSAAPKQVVSPTISQTTMQAVGEMSSHGVNKNAGQTTGQAANKIAEEMPGKNSEKATRAPSLQTASTISAAAHGNAFVNTQGVSRNWYIFIGGTLTHSLYFAAGKAPSRYAQALPDIDMSIPQAGVQPEQRQHSSPDASGSVSSEGETENITSTATSKPRLTIVIDDVGESMAKTRRLCALNFPVTLAVWPHSTNAEKSARLAHANRLEVLVHQPMEPVNYPAVNPGKGVLLRGMTETQISAQLEDNLKRVPYAIGLNNHMGSRLTQDETAMRIVATQMHKRGMLVLDSLTHPQSRFAKAALLEGATVYRRDVFLDVVDDKNEVLKQLKKLERLARLNGQAIAIGHPYQSTLDALTLWQSMRDKKVNIVRLQSLTPFGNSR